MALMLDGGCYGDDHVGGSSLKRSAADEARETALALRFERMFVQHEQQASNEQKGKKKKKKKIKKKIKNKQKKKGKQQGAGDTQNPLSRGFVPRGGSQIQGRAPGQDGKNEIAAFVWETCKILKERRRRSYIWEATKLLGTRAVAQLVSEVEVIEKNGGQYAPDGTRSSRLEVFWNILQAKLGDNVYEEIMSNAEALARERLEAEPRPQKKRQMEEPRSGSKRRKLPDEVFQALTLALGGSGDMKRPEVPASPDLVAESAIQELSLRFSDTVRFC